MDRDVKSLSNTNLDIESSYSSFIALVERAVKVATPRRFASSRKNVVKVNHPPCPWWNGECDKWVCLRKAALSRFRCTGRYEHFVEYRRQVAVTRKELRRIKRESFRSFCDGLRKDTNPSYVWNTVKKFDYRWNRTETDNAYREDKLEKVNNLIQELCPSWAPPKELDLTSPGSDEFLDLPFTSEELNFALSFVNNSSSPGLDGIDYLIIKKFSNLGRASY